LTFKDLLMTGPEAVCLADANMIIIQHNQNMNLLLGMVDKDLKGQNLSSIFYDDSVIQCLIANDKQATWYQGECILKTNSDLPLAVRFRAGKVIEHDHQETINVFTFGEIGELQRIIFSRRINALKSLLNSILTPDRKPEHILTNFFQAYDQDSEAFLLDLDFGNADLKESDRELLTSKHVILTSQIAINNKVPTMLQSEKLLCFFPVYTEKATYGVVCVKFSIPRLYDDEDKSLFDLCGKILGSCIEHNAMLDQNSYSDSLFDVIFKSVKQPIVVVNSNGLITKINNSAKTTYGFTDAEMLGNSFGNIVFPAESPLDYNNLISTIMKGDSIYDIEMPHIRSDFTMMDVSVTAYPYRASDGAIIGAVFIMQNKEDQKRLKDKMIQWEKLSVLGELLHSAANELNNSLTSVIGYSEILIQMENSDRVYDISYKIHKGAIRCGNVVKGLIDLARDDDTRKKHTSIDEAIRSALDLKRYQLRSNNIELNVKLDENVSFIVADLHDVERLFLHIINYAEKRMLEYANGGKLSIEAIVDELNFVVRFIDTGTCIIKYDIDDMVSCFSSLDEDIDVDLIASCQILKNIGGSIHIDSQIGKDNVIALKLPIMSSIPVELTNYDSEVFIQTNKFGKRILLVDDEVDIVDLLTEFLQEKDYLVDIARDGNEAIEKVFRNSYDLIISDMKMPKGFTGSKLHGFIKRKNPDLAKRMIFMTGDIINKETQKFLQSAGNPYLEKPFLPENLMKIIEQMNI
jgi:PAS domain S-box-containing protein